MFQLKSIPKIQNPPRSMAEMYFRLEKSLAAQWRRAFSDQKLCSIFQRKGLDLIGWICDMNSVDL